jgi:hypothetical protein
MVSVFGVNVHRLIRTECNAYFFKLSKFFK